MENHANRENYDNPDCGIYVHVPFCRRKCIYCDFYSIGERNADWDGYFEALRNEYTRRRDELGSVSSATLYIGGGTPSLMPAEMIGRLRRMIEIPVSEFTIEVNPDDVTMENANAWREAGVNRVSMGVQSLVDEELRMLGRRHDARSAVEAFHILRNEFDNVSLDLMFGLPWQTLASLSRTLDGFIEMNPEHISAYSLMYEEASALTRLRDAGKVSEIPELDNVDMFGMVSRHLAEAGYERYEISNYCRPGRRAIHNSLYWTGKPYLGLGPGSHSYDGRRVRRSNPADLKKYMESEGGKDNIVSEILERDELREEMIMTRLRTVEGLDLNEYGRRFGEREKVELLNKAGKWIDKGLQLKYRRLTLTESGVMISDEIISALF